MRTCPACGEDTKAETTEPCTECGFSPVSPEDGASWEQSSWAETPETTVPETTEEPQPIVVGPTADAPTRAQDYGLPEPTPPPQPTAKKPRVGAVWVILILIGFAGQAFNLFDGCGEIFDEATGPTAEETEAALVSDATMLGLDGATARCPDSAEDTEVGGRFDCTITTASGSSASVTVTNHEEDFEWSRQPLFGLLRQGGGP